MPEKHEWKGEHGTREGEWKVPYEKPGVPKGEAYGIAAVTQALEGLDFPASKDDILKRVGGNEEIHWTKEKTVNLRTIFMRTGQDQFESMAGIVSAVSDEARKEGISGEEGR